MCSVMCVMSVIDMENIIVIIISLILPPTFSFHIPLGFDLQSVGTVITVTDDLWTFSNWALHDPALEMMEEEEEKVEEEVEIGEEGWAWMSSVNINDWVPVFSSEATEDVFVSKTVDESEMTWSDYLLTEDWFERYNTAVRVLGERNEPVCQEKTFTCPDNRCGKIKKGIYSNLTPHHSGTPSPPSPAAPPSG